MSELIFRQAAESDKIALSQAIAFSFEDEFNDLTKDMQKIASALQKGINAERFSIAVQDNEILGIAGCADNKGRAVSVIPSELRKYLGLFKGTFAARQYYADFGAPLKCEDDTGFIEFVGVIKSARKRGIATKLIEYIISRGEYRRYMLDVLEENTAAQSVYEKMGFVKTGIHKSKHPMLDGFDTKIIMEYKGLIDNA